MELAVAALAVPLLALHAALHQTKEEEGNMWCTHEKASRGASYDTLRGTYVYCTCIHMYSHTYLRMYTQHQSSLKLLLVDEHG